MFKIMCWTETDGEAVCPRCGCVETDDIATRRKFKCKARHMIHGQHQEASPQYLRQYAGEAAWKEDHRSEANGTQASRALRSAMMSPVSRNWSGY